MSLLGIAFLLLFSFTFKVSTIAMKTSSCFANSIIAAAKQVRDEESLMRNMAGDYYQEHAT